MLRHPFGVFSVDCVDRSKEPESTVPKLPPPVAVSYRRDGDVSAVVNVVKKHPRVAVNAAVGAGKSTRIPIALGDALGLLVVHTIPSRHSAQYNAEYLGSLAAGERFTYMDDVRADMPQRGVVLMTNSYFLARMYTDRFGACPEFLLYMDENHESDSATAVLREVATTFSCVKHVVFATATSEPGMELTPYMPGKRQVLQYPRTPTRQWSATDVGKPWSAAAIDQNTVIFMDRTSTVQKLMAEYRGHGFIVHALTSRSSYASFKDAIAALKDVRGAVTILFLDYSFRSSLTLPRVSTIIDSGEVALASVIDGAPGYIYRDAYDFETQQALARGGRLEGDSVKLYKPDTRAPKRMCDLESLEGDAAALMYRMLGFRPPHLCYIFGETSGPVPIDLVGAFQGETPLKLYPPESREAWVQEGRKPVGLPTVPDKYAFQSTVGVRPRPASCRTAVDSVYVRSPSPPLNMLHNITEVDSDTYSDYANARRESPPLTPIRTLTSSSIDNLSVLLDDENPPYARPKRIAKRVLDERAAEKKAADGIAGIASDRVGPEPATSVSVVQLADQVLEVRGKAGKVFDELARSATQVKQNAAAQNFEAGANQVQSVRALYETTRAASRKIAIEDDDIGTYYYYHGIDRAPEDSSFFVTGYDSILEFCEGGRGKGHTSVLPERDKLYAIKVLLDKYNASTATVFGIQRLMFEIHKRPKEEFQDLLDPGEFGRTLQWALNRLNVAKADVLLMRKLLNNFMDRPPEKMAQLSHLEHTVMREVLDKFEYAAVAKDPDKVTQYFDRLNNHKVKILQSDKRRLK